MSIHRDYSPRACVLFALLAVGCSGASTDEPRYLPGAVAGGGIVAPLKDDSSEEIVSWVDGEIVRDWTAEIVKRDRAIAGYLDDDDPARAQKYGFRSGQHPRLAWNWFTDHPVGFNGVPFVLFKTILDLDPNHNNPTLRAIARIWKRESAIPLGTGSASTTWTFDHIGLMPNPRDYVDGVARPVGERTAPLPYGLVFENEKTFEPLSGPDEVMHNGRLLSLRVLLNTGLLIAKLRTADHEERWEANRDDFGTPGEMDRVFFSCAACHVGRVAVAGKMRFLPGMPNTEVEAQVLFEAADAHRRGAG